MSQNRREGKKQGANVIIDGPDRANHGVLGRWSKEVTNDDVTTRGRFEAVTAQEANRTER